MSPGCNYNKLSDISNMTAVNYLFTVIKTYQHRMPTPFICNLSLISSRLTSTRSNHKGVIIIVLFFILNKKSLIKTR